MDLGIKDKIAIIGGGSKGIGYACAEALAAEGTKIVIAARGKEALGTAEKKLSKLTEVLAVQTDLSKEDDIKKLIKTTLDQFGSIDILVLNTGGPAAGGFFDVSTKDWNEAFESTLLYPVRMLREVIPSMQKNTWGRIVNIVSLTAKQPRDDLILSNVFRPGVVALSKIKSIAKDNILINNIAPGSIRTERHEDLVKKLAKREGKTVEAIHERLTKETPLNRMIEPEELGRVVAFLCSNANTAVTGTTIEVDGGAYKGLY